MHFGSDTNTFNQSYDFMVGDQLLAAPVYTDNATNRGVYLPDGPGSWYQIHEGDYWFDWHNHEKYDDARWAEIAAPLGVMPLFARAGAIVPQGPSMQYVDEFKPDYLDVHMWPADSSTDWTLYEDDGISPTSTTYETTFVNADSSNSWTVNVEAATGSYDPERDAYIIILHDISSVTNVMINTTNLTSKSSIVGCTDKCYRVVLSLQYCK